MLLTAADTGAFLWAFGEEMLDCHHVLLVHLQTEAGGFADLKWFPPHTLAHVGPICIHLCVKQEKHINHILKGMGLKSTCINLRNITFLEMIQNYEKVCSHPLSCTALCCTSSLYNVIQFHHWQKSFASCESKRLHKVQRDEQPALCFHPGADRIKLCARGCTTCSMSGHSDMSLGLSVAESAKLSVLKTGLYLQARDSHSSMGSHCACCSVHRDQAEPSKKKGHNSETAWWKEDLQLGALACLQRALFIASRNCELQQLCRWIWLVLGAMSLC